MSGVEFDPRRAIPASRRAGITRSLRSSIVPLNARAVLGDGSVVDRAELLRRLNLDPNTPPEAWLAIVACGSNASALNMRDAEKLAQAGKLPAKALGEIKQMRGIR